MLFAPWQLLRLRCRLCRCTSTALVLEEVPVLRFQLHERTGVQAGWILRSEGRYIEALAPGPDSPAFR